MRKNKETTPLEALFAAQSLGKKLKEEIEKQQKRLWLRTEIHEITGCITEDFEKIFDWIYYAPIYDWGGMLYCFKHEAELKNRSDNYAKVLEKAKNLYALLK